MHAAKYIGLKEMVPAYLDPSLTIDELISGVSFASAGSGFDPLTPSISVSLSLSLPLSPSLFKLLTHQRSVLKMLT